mmetsp:Transcript_20754/g.51126  ORF Transcript_20754/g.51126 Transcript_20754/m.51126 type:complete len:164 (+) Transcript_20754:250-741(+)
MVSYCMNDAECRQSQLLLHFGEHQEPPAETEKCCDNCDFRGERSQLDVTQHAVRLNGICKELNMKNGWKPTIPYLLDVYHGSLGRMKKNSGHEKLEGFGQGSQCDENIILRTIELMIQKGVLKVYGKRSIAGWRSYSLLESARSVQTAVQSDRYELLVRSPDL